MGGSVRGEPRQLVGMDFGTSTTLLAQAQGGDSARSVPLGLSTPWLPSAVGRQGGQWVVGEVAETLADALLSVKNFITRDKESMDVGPFTGMSVREPVSAILAEAVTRADRAGLPLSGRPVRMGCPAMWKGGQRSFLAGVARGAGLDVEVDDIVDEPIAAGVAWVWERFLEHHERVEGKVLVIDYGGGTVDLALLEVEFREEPKVTVLSARGYRGAGDDLDHALVERIRATYVSRGVPPGRLDEPTAGALLRLAARDAKERLSIATQTEVRLGAPYGDLPEVSLSRAELEEAFAPQVDRALEEAWATLKEAHVHGRSYDLSAIKGLSEIELAKDVSHVLLAGGMAMIPYVASRVQAALPAARVDRGSKEHLTTQVVRGLATNRAYDSISLHRPGLDLVLQWSDSGLGGGESVIYPAFTPLYEPWQVLGGYPLRFEARYPWPGSTAAPARMVARTAGGREIALRGPDGPIAGIPVVLGPGKALRLEIQPNGGVMISDARPDPIRFRVAKWPYIRFSSQHRSGDELLIEVAPRDSGWLAERYKYPHK